MWETGAMTEELHEVVHQALAPVGRIIELTDALEPLRRPKSALEQNLLRRAGQIMAGAVARLRKEVAAGVGGQSAAVRAENEAYALGAQNALVYTSRRDGGPVLPFDCAVDPKASPMLASLSVRYGGYWATGHVTLNSSSPALAQAEAALREVVARVRPGVSAQALAEAADQALGSLRRNPARKLLHGIGLSLEEAPCGCCGKATLEAGDVCVVTLETPVECPPASRALVSAMLLVSGAGAELL